MKSFKVKTFHIPGDGHGNWCFNKMLYSSMEELLDAVIKDPKISTKDTRLNFLSDRGRITYLTLAVAVDEHLVAWSACSVLDQCSRRYGFLIALNRLAHTLEFENKDLHGCRLYARDVLYFADDSDLKAEDPDPELMEAFYILGDLKRLLKEEQALASARNAKRMVAEAKRLQRMIDNKTQKLSKIQKSLTSVYPPMEEIKV